MPRFRIRGVLPKDHDDLVRVAKHLNSVNLPEDVEAVRGIIDHSVQSFLGKVASKRAEYVFALEDLQTGHVVGTSMVIGQLGRRDAPYIYFDVRSEEKYSSTLDKHFHHTVLRIGYSYDGPTEIGGIVLLPEYRLGTERLGQFLSYVRFLFIATNRDRFRDEVLAELLPPLEPDGTSHLWEALGRHFTGLSYMEADKLSKKNKEFIKGLFPEGDVYASVLRAEAQKVIGEVGPQTKGVEKLLERIGFRYCERVDPFDGGPHFLANTDDITLVQDSARVPLVELWPGDPPPCDKPRHRAVVATLVKEPPFWRSVMVPFEQQGEGLVITERAAEAIGAKLGDEVMFLPIHTPKPKGHRA
ncbi:MAG: arginine N-succinyltransferase [Deltaproteobacteria bacterium]|nr:arginine N-succinyltransferase [Deltaproteobacteria bacterium]